MFRIGIIGRGFVGSAVAHGFSPGVAYDSEIKIYGRFGKKMFESNGYETPWDGTNEKGRAVPDGTYFYIINLGNGHDPIKGTITIIR